ncbi:uncharacterized protein LOC115679401 [Syzygium oleosum]|uniref:uncharacterized protein LOC115679401 n=1 Tax=Syzygium oleosum TaxID=219896 RepID=UPI0024B949FC|nr:uncharacterized protein LOC115679401 [Syzygium oleosum]
MDNWPVLSRLKRAVKKARLLLSFDVRRWRLALVIGAASGKSWQRRRLSFDDWPGLMGCMDDGGRAGSESSGSRREIWRTMSYPSSPSEEDDIDKRADVFISNFHRQLQMERQISLELRYCRANSFGSMSS